MTRWMMKKTSLKHLAVAVFVLVSLGACGPQALQSVFGNASWIDKPLANSTLPLGAHEVISHANSPEGIAAFELSVDGVPIAMNDVPADQYGESLAYITQLWNPTEAGIYELSIRAMDVSGEYGPPTSIMVQVVDETEEEPAAAPTEEGVVVVEEPTAEAGVCTYEALVNLFCREGSDTRFEAIDSFTPGQTAPVVGMSTDGFYWYVLGPLSSLQCTVPSAERYGFVTGDCSGLPQFTPMPTPADTPTSTVTPTPTPTVVPATPTRTPIPPPA